MNYSDLKQYISSDKIDQILQKITCDGDIQVEKQRYLNLLQEAYELYGDGDYHFISSPGRSEVGGNHTDHQHGHVLACSLNIDNVCIVKANKTNICNYVDKLFNPIKVNLDNLDINKDEFNTSESLIRGIAYKLNELGYTTGGFDAVCDSHVLIGSGISSSACFEVMITEIFNALFNEDKVDPINRAIICQFAENTYYGKPCGLMDQMAISVGSFIGIDFKDPKNPIIENHEFSFADYGYDFVLINTNANHMDLTNEYAAIPNEMKLVGKELGVEYLADSSLNEFINNLPQIRNKVKNDRAILRAFHFFNEDKRAIDEKDAIKNKDIKKLLYLINQSGKSSYEYLQNVYPASIPDSQPIAIALSLTDGFLNGEGAYRVHGGGFGGTIQAVIPHEKMPNYKQIIEPIFGENSVMVLKVRPLGTIKII